jgi:uncharacterized protein YjiS (DUF1127 family)
MMGFAVEMKRVSTRKLGVLMEQRRKAGLMAKGGQPHQRKPTGLPKNPVATLAALGIDKNLAEHAASWPRCRRTVRDLSRMRWH